MIEDVLGFAGVEASLQEISLGCDIPPGLPAVHADPIHVAQVVLDLIRCAPDAINGTRRCSE